ncbi:helix-turn-helix domain-containing protein [Dehalobacter restrictus]|uniref:Helix-turn-helix domain-containing protein n=1 Tax=Dehalobacter restrictus TaxID=55583 RepID=A0A857DLM4_9FIRM|nr:helix-turn-helix domain-containing protein [Dehalobacter restrictus]
MADVVGSTRVGVTQILKELTRQGLLSRMGKSLLYIRKRILLIGSRNNLE